MKTTAPFDQSIPPPKRFWSALWKPGMQPDYPDSEYEIMRRSMVPGAPHVILNSEKGVRPDGFGLWSQIKRISTAVAHWFVRRDAQEEHELRAAADGLQDVSSRKRDVERTRYFKYVSH